MFRQGVLLLAVLLSATQAWAAPSYEGTDQGQGNRPPDSVYHRLTMDTSTSQSMAFTLGASCSVTFTKVGSGNVVLYEVPLKSSAYTDGTAETTFTASTTEAYTFKPGLRYGMVRAASDSDGSVVEITCSNVANLAASAGGSAVNSSNYDPGDAANALLASVTDPSTTQLGVGISFGDPTTFSANPDGEADNLMGFFYNKSGINYVGRLNQYEHAMDDSYETAYRHTSGTGDHTWMERNLDLFLPDNTVTLSSIHANFNPAVGETVYFSGGGQGKVISWSSPTLVWRQDYGATAAGETVYDDDGNPAETATLGTPTAVTSQFRTYQWEWDTLLNQSKFFWYTLSGDQTGAPYYEQDDRGPAFRLQPVTLSGRVKTFAGIGASTAVASESFTVEDSALAGNTVMTVKQKSAGLDDLDAAVGTADGWGGGTFTILKIQGDYSATNTAFSSPIFLHIPTPTAKGSGSTVERPNTIRIDDQGGYGATGGPAIFLRDQSCLAAGACSSNPGRFGNILLGGGDYNNGHFSFGDTVAGYDGDADHIWVDQTTLSGTPRMKRSANPTSATDGNAFVLGTGSTAHGIAKWGISDASGAATFDTGTEVCAASALTCQDVIEFSTVGTPTDSACATAHANGVKFMAMCY